METKVNYINNFFFSNSIEYIANNRILQFTSRNSVTSLFLLAKTDTELARLHHSTYPSALVSTCQMRKGMRHTLPINVNISTIVDTLIGLQSICDVKIHSCGFIRLFYWDVLNTWLYPRRHSNRNTRCQNDGNTVVKESVYLTYN